MAQEIIPVYIGMSKKFEAIKGLTKNSILAHTDHEVRIVHLYDPNEQGCTGFTNVRYKIRKGIYLDPDMIVFGDVADLWKYRVPGKFVCMKDGATEVAVIDCKHGCTKKSEERLLPKHPAIPLEWNCEDEVKPGMKLLHFTSLKTQPWFHEHPNKEVVAIWEAWRDRV